MFNDELIPPQEVIENSEQAPLGANFIESLQFEDAFMLNEPCVGSKRSDDNPGNVPAAKRNYPDNSIQEQSLLVNEAASSTLTEPAPESKVLFKPSSAPLAGKGRALIDYVLTQNGQDFTEGDCARAIKYKAVISKKLLNSFYINNQSVTNFRQLKPALLKCSAFQLDALKASMVSTERVSLNRRVAPRKADLNLDKIGLSRDKYNRFLLEILALGYNEAQANRIILRKGSTKTCEYLINHHSILYAVLSAEMSGAEVYIALTKVVAHDGGSNNFSAVIDHYEALKALGFSAEQIIRMVNHGGGSKNISAVIENYDSLIALEFAVEQIVCMVSHIGGSKNLSAVIGNYESLKALAFTAEQIIRMASRIGGSKNISAVIENYDSLKALGFNAEQIIRMVSHDGGSNNLSAVQGCYEQLKALGFSAEQIIRMVSHGGGSKNLSAVKENYGPIKALGFNAEQIICIVSHGGGSNNLSAVKESCEQLKALGFNVEQIIRMVNHDGGSKNLYAVKDNYEALKALGFSAEQIISIVSHIGGSKNLFAVEENYEALKALGFNAKQIIRMVSHDGGSNNLYVVQENYQLLSILQLNAEQIVRMVSYDGGSNNLECVVHYLIEILSKELKGKDIVIKTPQDRHRLIELIKSEASLYQESSEINPEQQFMSINEIVDVFNTEEWISAEPPIPVANNRYSLFATEPLSPAELDWPNTQDFMPF